MRLPDPSAERLIRGEAFRTLEGLVAAGEHRWREGDRVAGRHVDGQPRVQAAGGRERQPATDGMAVHPQQVCHVLAGAGWPTGQQIEPLETGLLLAIMCTLPSVFQRIRMVRNRR
jgi:hypothetical protein